MIHPDSHTTIGVPVYRGERYLAEALESIRAQTCGEYRVVISLDGPDPACEAIARRFISDERFELHIQPERLGWVGNINWLLRHATGSYWYFHQQDDLVASDYLSALRAALDETPAAALAYCDIQGIGAIDRVFSAAPVTGRTALARLLVLLYEHFSAVAFRGLVRLDAARRAGPIPENAASNVGVDIAWLAAVALSGDLVRVPRILYQKRYHDANTESGWWAWSQADRRAAWTIHCAGMLRQALRATTGPQEALLAWYAALERLLGDAAAAYVLDVAATTDREREEMLDRFVAQVESEPPEGPAARLAHERGWLASSARDFLDAARQVRIVDYGPRSLGSGGGLILLGAGGQGVWARVDGLPLPGTRLALNGAPLPTVSHGDLLTGTVLDDFVVPAGRLELGLVGPDGAGRSETVPIVPLPDVDQG